MTKKTKNLDELRQEIDEIDDTIHDLIMRRTLVVEGVRDLKKGQAVKIRPSREAKILLRLFSRHQGHFPKPELARIWRELIVATLGFEGPFSIAVPVIDDGFGYYDLARDQYGSHSDLKEFPSSRRVVEAVRDGKATVGIVPIPVRAENDPWWRHLVSENPNRPKVIARLPVAGPGNGHGSHLEALVICQVEVEETGRDLSLFAIDADEEITPSKMVSNLKACGLEETFIYTWHDESRPEIWLHLVEVKGFMANEDPRLEAMANKLGIHLRRIVPLGGYCDPFRAEELSTDNEDGAK
ncbi:MAG: chorismate mutase [Rhodospirillales bacterium]|nr:chorismate mutase [Rhodospirillales bacterium]